MISLNRRKFLTTGLMGAGAVSAVPFLPACSNNSLQGNRLISATKQQGFSISSIAHNQIASIETGFRGHGVALHPIKPDTAIMFGRRPAVESVEVDLKRNQIIQTINADNNCNMQGHGCFSADGAWLYTIEMDNQTAEGKIVIRNALDYQVVKVLSTFGIGPHEASLMPDGKTLVVANGGIMTRPETGRDKLNLDTMDSNLSYVDLSTGNLLQQVRVPEAKASIRHLDVSDDGIVVVSMQLQRQSMRKEDQSILVPLMAKHQLSSDSAMVLLHDEMMTERLQDYVGSVVINSKHRLACCTSPVGNIALFWNIDTGKLQASHRLSDVCGVATNQNEFILSNSLGHMRVLDAMTLQEKKDRRQKYENTRFDNHMIIG